MELKALLNATLMPEDQFKVSFEVISITENTVIGRFLLVKNSEPIFAGVLEKIPCGETVKFDGCTVSPPSIVFP